MKTILASIQYIQSLTLSLTLEHERDSLKVTIFYAIFKKHVYGPIFLRVI